MQCCESPAEERSAGNPHATFCGNWRRATASSDPVGGIARCPPIPIYRACHPAILDHRGRRLTPATLLPPPSMRGFTPPVTLGDANEKRDWRIYRDFANTLIAQARRLYADDAFAVDLDNSVYALDTTTIDLSLKVFPWAHFRTTKAAVKMHTQIDLRGNIPSFIHVSDGKMHEVNVLDLMTPEGGSFTIMDRGFLDFARLYRLTQAGAFFVIRPKSNTAFQRVYSRSVDKTTGLRCDQTVRLTGVTSANDYPQYLRYVVFYDEENDKRLGFFTNNFELPALTIAQLYKCRWQVDIDQAWRLSRLCEGRGRSGLIWRRQTPPWERGSADCLQGCDRRVVGMDEDGMTSAHSYKAAA